MIKLTNLYKIILQEYKDINVAVDMTCGNGYDTLFLSKIAKKVYSFDIQDISIIEAKNKMKDRSNVCFINDDHTKVLNYVHEGIDVAIYNLGYLPGGDKTITTKADSTIASLKSLLTILNETGVVIIEVYPHNKEENNRITEFTSNLNNNYDVLKVDLHNKENPPYLIIIRKALI